MGDETPGAAADAGATPVRQRARVVFALACTAMILSAPGQSYLVSVFVDDMIDGLDLTRTTFSIIYAFATVLSATFSLLFGRATDRFGLRALWLVAGIGLGASCLLTSWASGVLLATISLLGLRAFGHGPFPLLGTLIVNHRFKARRGAAIAGLNVALAGATIALPPLLALLIDGIGWQASYRILGVVVLALLPLSLLVPGRKRPEAGAGSASPDPAAAAVAAVAADAGAPAPGIAATVSGGDVSPAAAAATAATAVSRSRRLARRLDLDRSAVLLLVAFAATPVVATGLSFHAVSLLGGRGLDRPAAALAISMMGISGVIVSVLSATFVDRLRTRTLLVGMSACLVASALLFLIPVGAIAYPAFALLGLNVSLFGIVSGVAWARSYGLARIGRYQGLSFCVISVFAAAGPLPLALSLGASGSYTPGMVFLVAFAAIGVLAALRWRPPAGAVGA
jgi:hypothetical protein